VPWISGDATVGGRLGSSRVTRAGEGLSGRSGGLRGLGPVVLLGGLFGFWLVCGAYPLCPFSRAASRHCSGGGGVTGGIAWDMGARAS